MWDFLREMNRAGTTIILTTHYLEEAETLCRDIAIIDGGDIIENTSMKELIARLNTETFVLDLGSPIPAAPVIDGYRFRLVDASTLEVEVNKALGMNALFRHLSEMGIEVQSLRNKANRLEELFIHLLDRNNGSDAPA